MSEELSFVEYGPEFGLNELIVAISDTNKARIGWITNNPISKITFQQATVCPYITTKQMKAICKKMTEVESRENSTKENK